ncbi:hypothetical protein C6502_11840 [Candidatus Poribacteria bacterium]|nr:MAG: hypothetical protein C6502_11840 [Candidatus Poribacteria bacterium]
MYLRFLPFLPHSNPSVFQSVSSRLLWLIVASILLLSGGVAAQEAIRILSHDFDPDHITIGDPIQLQLRIEVDENLHIYLDPIDRSEHEYIEVEKPQVKRIESENLPTGKAHYEVTYPLRAFAIGKHALPPMTIKYTDTDGDSGSIQTPAYLFEVQAVKPAGATEMKGIKGPWSAPPNWFLYILGAFLVVVAIGTIIFLHLRRRVKPMDRQPEAVPQRQPHEIAYEQLSRIEGMNWVAQGEMKIYHTEISHVLRQYIAARYRIPALELTTQELLDRLQPEDVPKELVQQCFSNCDLVKFARYSPTKPEAHERMEEARRIVDETKQFWVGVSEEKESEISEDL